MSTEENLVNSSVKTGALLLLGLLPFALCGCSSDDGPGACGSGTIEAGGECIDACNPLALAAADNSLLEEAAKEEPT
jgi:aerobic-type carbon monoxide dehydrogenase small subunit (CoxS/CutS family)